MTHSTERHVDPEIVNLSGGLFDSAHVRAPVEPTRRHAPRPASPAPFRSARRARWVVGAVVVALLLATGFAEARQVSRVATSGSCAR